MIYSPRVGTWPRKVLTDRTHERVITWAPKASWRAAGLLAGAGHTRVGWPNPQFQKSELGTKYTCAYFWLVDAGNAARIRPPATLCRTWELVGTRFNHNQHYVDLQAPAQQGLFGRTSKNRNKPLAYSAEGNIRLGGRLHFHLFLPCVFTIWWPTLKLYQTAHARTRTRTCTYTADFGYACTLQQTWNSSATMAALLA